MAHDSYQCRNEHLTRTSPRKVFPFPTQQRNGRYYVGGALEPAEIFIRTNAQRPTDHQSIKTGNILLMISYLFICVDNIVQYR